MLRERLGRQLLQGHLATPCAFSGFILAMHPELPMTQVRPSCSGSQPGPPYQPCDRF